jgi:Ca-activated chloride channel family protein
MSRRVILPFMLALSGCFASIAAEAATWSDVWLTREQQGQRLLDAKQPEAAAHLFSDPRRQAYAELQAGQYAKAAKLLEPFRDADSQYNRGNALAHTGQLRRALQAYDAALRTAPGNQDVIRNRDLVRRALEQQQQDPQQAGGSGRKNTNQPDRNGEQQHSPGADSQQSQSANASGNRDQRPAQSSQAAQAGNPGQSQPNQSQSNQSQANQSQANANSSQAAKQSQANQSQAGGQSQGGNQQSTASGQPQSAGQPSGSNSGQDNSRPGNPASAQPANSALARAQGQQPEANGAQQDAEAGLRYQQSQQARAGSARAQTGPNSMGAVNPRAGTTQPDNTPPQPPSEQSLALDQWLRGIPEDSGELLQRKFLIEHMLRQRGNEQ